MPWRLFAGRTPRSIQLPSRADDPTMPFAVSATNDASAPASVLANISGPISTSP